MERCGDISRCSQLDEIIQHFQMPKMGFVHASYHVRP